MSETLGVRHPLTRSVALLANYAPTLSAALGKEACLPNGNFIFPGQASIWNPDYFFTISITVGSRSRWTYEHVKLIVSGTVLCRSRHLHLPSSTFMHSRRESR